MRAEDPRSHEHCREHIISRNLEILKNQKDETVTTTLMSRSLITRWGGPRSETTQLMSEVDRFLTGKSPKCLRL